MSRFSTVFRCSMVLFGATACLVDNEGKDSGSASSDLAVCASVGVGCQIDDPSGDVLCLEVVDYTGGSEFEDAFVGECDSLDGTVLPGGCPKSGQVCGVLGAEYPNGTAITYFYGTGPVAEAGCGACGMDGVECC